MAPTLKRARDNRDGTQLPPTKKTRVDEAAGTGAMPAATRGSQHMGKNHVRVAHPLPPPPPPPSKKSKGVKPSTVRQTSTSSKKRKRVESEHESKASTCNKKMRFEQPADTVAAPPTAATTAPLSDPAKRDSTGVTARATTSPPQQRKKIEFLDLPAEMRNRIYEFALPEPEDKSFAFLTPKEKVKALEPPLLRVNRQIRHEALPMYWGSGIVLHSLDVAANCLNKITTEKRAMLKDVRVKAPSPARVAEHTLRRVRRALMAWDKGYAKKGLAAAVVRVEMPVTSHIRMPEQPQEPQEEVVWCYLKRNSAEELKAEVHEAQEKDQANKTKAEEQKKDQQKYQQMDQEEDRTQDQTQDQTQDEGQQPKPQPKDNEMTRARKDPKTGAEDIRLFMTKRTVHNIFVTLRNPLPTRKQNTKKTL